MGTFFMTTRDEKNPEGWEETVLTEVPTTERFKRGYVKKTITDPVEAAKAIIDFWNATLQPHDRPRQVIAVTEHNDNGEKNQIWSGVHPAIGPDVSEQDQGT